MYARFVVTFHPEVSYRIFMSCYMHKLIFDHDWSIYENWKVSNPSKINGMISYSFIFDSIQPLSFQIIQNNLLYVRLCSLLHLSIVSTRILVPVTLPLT
jgi:hypothetical protein